MSPSLITEGSAPRTTVDEPARLSTHAEYCQAAYAWRRLHTVELYEQSNDDPPWLSERVAAWLDDCARADADLGGAPGWLEIEATGEQLYESGCRHPLFVSRLAERDLVSGRIDRSRERHEAISAPLLAGEYGPVNRFFEAFRIMRLDYLWGLSGPRYESEKRAARAWLDMAASTKGRLQQRLLWSELGRLTSGRRGSAWDREWLADFMKQSATDGRLRPWMQSMLAGQAFHMEAWGIRGGTSSTEVDPGNWEPFYAAISAAEFHAQEAHRLAPEFPEAATLMILVSRDQEGTRDERRGAMRLWFDRAREAQVDYRSAFSTLSHASRERWGGGPETLWDLAREWSQERRADTIVPYMAVRTVYDIGRDLGSRRKALDSDESYSLVMNNLQRMADDPAHAASRSREYARGVLLSHRVAAAMRAKRDRDARQALDAMTARGLEFDDSIVAGYGLTPRRQLARLIARTGPAKREVKALGRLSWNDLHSSHDAASAGAAGYAAAQLKADDPRTDAYFDHRVRLLENERDFYSGDWVDLRFDKEFAGWRYPEEGLWEVEGPHTVVARQSDQSGVPEIRHNGAFGEAFEIEVDIEPLFEAGDSSLNGVYVRAAPEGYYFWLNRTVPLAYATPGAECSVAMELTEKPAYTLTVRVRRGHAQMLIDGQEVFARQFERGEFLPTGEFSLGAVPRAGHGSEVRYRNPRIRRLTE